MLHAHSEAKIRSHRRFARSYLRTLGPWMIWKHAYLSYSIGNEDFPSCMVQVLPRRSQRPSMRRPMTRLHAMSTLPADSSVTTPRRRSRKKLPRGKPKSAVQPCQFARDKMAAFVYNNKFYHKFTLADL